MCLYVCSQSLKVECCKLRARVVEVQQQNDELRRLFCDRARNQFTTDDIMAIHNLQVDAAVHSGSVCVHYRQLGWKHFQTVLHSVVSTSASGTGCIKQFVRHF